MQVEVETGLSGGRADEEREPVAFMLGNRRLAVVRVLDRWFGRDHAYFKLEADDGAHYILRRGSAPYEWEMYWFAGQDRAPADAGRLLH